MALPTLTLLDSFKRANEKPLANLGKWAKLFPEVTAGEIAVELFKATTGFAGGEDGAYWTPVEFTNPAVALTIKALAGVPDRFYQIWACVSNPTTTEISGYRVRFQESSNAQEVAGQGCKVVIEKCVKNVFTTLATISPVTWAVNQRIALQVTGGKVIAWKEAGGTWAIVGEAADSTFTKGFIGMGSKAATARLSNFEAGESVPAHEHTLTVANGQTPTMSRTPARTLTATQAQAPVLQRVIAKALSVTQGQAPSLTRTLARAFAATQGQLALVAKAVSRTLTSAQAQAVIRATSVVKVFNVTQVSSYSTQLPTTPITEQLETLGALGAAWTILAWTEAIGTIQELHKGLTKQPHPVGWAGSVKTAGARYNVLSVSDPINFMAIRNASPLAERYVAIGICVPSNGERSGYLARVEGVAGESFKVTLERWINGAKTVLAEATLPEAYFGLERTGKEAPFGLTLVGHTLRLWLSGSENTAPTVLLEAADSTFTSGYNTMENKGESSMLAQMHVASMDGQIRLISAFSKGHILTAEPQSQAATLAPKAISRSLTASQGQSVTRATQLARLLLGSATQVASRRSAISRSLSATSPQVATVLEGHARFHTLTVAQPQSAARAASVGRTLAVAQGQAPTRSKSISRALSAAAASVAAHVAALGRTLRVAQPQAASKEATSESHGHPHTLTMSQAQTAALGRALARTLTASPHSSATLARSPTRLLSGATGSAASIRVALTRSLTATATQSASLGATQVRGSTLSMSQGQVARLGRAVGRRLSATQQQAASISLNTIEVPLPPPVNMSSSTTTGRGDSTATSKAHDSHVSGRRLTSSVGIPR